MEPSASFFGPTSLINSNKKKCTVLRTLKERYVPYVHRKYSTFKSKNSVQGLMVTLYTVEQQNAWKGQQKLLCY